MVIAINIIMFRWSKDRYPSFSLGLRFKSDSNRAVYKLQNVFKIYIDILLGTDI